MEVKEIKAKSILNRSSIADYCINPYVGCQHACGYCYADYYTKRYYHVKKQWGSYVWVKVNAVGLLLKEITKKKKGTVYLSSLTDPYQPMEAKYRLTREILKILLRYGWSVIIQTKSTLVLRDLDIIKKFRDIEVGFTIITLNEKLRKKFEPFSSSIKERIKALRILKKEGVRTFAFLGPIMPFTSFEEVDRLVDKVRFVDKIYFDKLRYKPGLERSIPKSWFEAEAYYKELKKRFSENGIFVY